MTKRRRATSRKIAPTEPVVPPAEFVRPDHRLREVWHRAGRAPRITSDLELISYGRPEMTDAQARAWNMLSTMLKPLSPLHRATLAGVCCFEHGAELTVANLGRPAHVGLLVLRDALEALSRTKRRRAA